LKQKAKILIAELDLHKSSGGTTDVPYQLGIVQSNNKPTQAPPFCPKPIGEKICNTNKSKVIYQACCKDSACGHINSIFLSTFTSFHDS